MRGPWLVVIPIFVSVVQSLRKATTHSTPETTPISLRNDFTAQKISAFARLLRKFSRAGRRGRCASRGGFWRSISQHECRDQSDAQKTNQLDEHVGRNVALRKAIPVPIRNICRDRGQDSRHGNEAHPPTERGKTSLREQEHGENGLGQFSGKFNAEPTPKCECTCRDDRSK
jgi:hypothetical protein